MKEEKNFVKSVRMLNNELNKKKFDSNKNLGEDKLKYYIQKIDSKYKKLNTSSFKRSSKTTFNIFFDPKKIFHFLCFSLALISVIYLLKQSNFKLRSANLKLTQPSDEEITRLTEEINNAVHEDNKLSKLMTSSKKYDKNIFEVISVYHDKESNMFYINGLNNTQNIVSIIAQRNKANKLQILSVNIE